MKKTIISFYIILSLLILPNLLISCGGKSRQSKCSVEVFSPEKRYSDIKLLDNKGKVIDSTLTVKNDSIRFYRTDSLSMPYVVTLQLLNPSDSLDYVQMPIIIEGGTVKLDLSDQIFLGGTGNNEILFKFLKAKNSFIVKYNRGENTDYDVARMKRDYSRFYADQIILNKGNVVGEYLMEAYEKALTKEDLERVRNKMEK